MLATQGGEVRIFSRSARGRAEAAEWVRGELAAVATTLGGTPGQIVDCADVEEAVDGVGFVVEAVPEQVELKRQVLGDADRLMPRDAILGSNSSSYPASQLLDNVHHTERLVNTHFYMPPVQNFVEVMSCGETDPHVIETLLSLLPRYGLEPLHVRKESMGFVFNRVWAAIKREALTVVAEGVATPEDVDRIFQANLGADEAPFRLMDKVGLDVVLAIEERYAAEMGGGAEGARGLLRSYVDQGRLGTKSGSGFYDDYSSPVPPGGPIR